MASGQVVPLKNRLGCDSFATFIAPFQALSFLARMQLVACHEVRGDDTSPIIGWNLKVGYCASRPFRQMRMRDPENTTPGSGMVGEQVGGTLEGVSSGSSRLAAAFGKRNLRK